MLLASPGVLRADALAARFDALDRFVAAHHGLWHPRPFAQRPLPWEQEHPRLARWLAGLDDEAIDAIDAGARGLRSPADAPAPLAEWLDGARSLTTVGRWPERGDIADRLGREPRLRRGARARKWAQVGAFSAAVMPPSPDASHLVDWCGGTGHLGRTLGVLSGRAVTVVEQEGRLEARGRELADAVGAELRFVVGDALSPETRRLLPGDAMVLALHACGGLSNALIRGLDPSQVPDIAIAPCCYHLKHEGGAGRIPLSARGRASALPLDHATLRLATVEEVAASPQLRRRRRRESAWRQGLDALLRDASGGDRYTPLGTLPPPWLALPFEGFCRRVAAAQALDLPPHWSPSAYRREGEERARAARALGLVRAVFRRPLELWLVLDRALALEEAGYEVGVGTFCERAVTPRNLLIRGVRG